MSDETPRDRWIREVFRTPHVSDAVRVVLLALGWEMDEDAMVSISEEELSSTINRTDRRTRGRIKAGVEAGFIERVARGQRNGKSRYRGILPGGPSTGHPGVLKNVSLNRTPGGPEEKLQPDTLQPEENPLQPDTRGSSREPFDPSVFRTPGGPEETAPIYKARARAHSNGDPSTPNEHESAHGDRQVVAGLFEDVETSLRSKKTPARKRANEPAEDPEFAQFWAAYPRRVAKPAALKAWAKAIKSGADPEQIILSARRYATDPRRKESDIKYTAHPATWLNQERYADEPEEQQQPVPVLRRSTADERFAQAQALKAELFGAGTPPSFIRGELA